MTRTIRLNPQIRRDMAEAIHQAWLKEHPRPKVNRLPTSPEVRVLDAWKADSRAYHQQAVTILATFKSVNELSELWPAAMKFVPTYVLDPARHFKLPRKRAA